jgi:thioredoxin
MFGMTEATKAPTALSKSDLVKEGSEATFMADVIDMSQTVPVIVDFWAPWCGPCKTLGPQLEAAVTAAKGAVRMVKIDVDRAPALSQQLRIQSIPTVYAFYKGQPVDGFQGAVPGSEVKKFVEKLAALNPEDGGLAEAIEAAEAMLAEGAVEDAAETFAAILAEEPENAQDPLDQDSPPPDPTEDQHQEEDEEEQERGEKSNNKRFQFSPVALEPVKLHRLEHSDYDGKVTQQDGDIELGSIHTTENSYKKINSDGIPGGDTYNALHKLGLDQDIIDKAINWISNLF